MTLENHGNFTLYEISAPEVFYEPRPPCVDWCITQKVVGYHNLEINALMIVSLALILIIIYEWANEYEATKKYAHYFPYFAKLLLYFFFYIYFFYIKGGT